MDCKAGLTGKGVDAKGQIWVADEESKGAWLEFRLKEYVCSNREMELYSFEYKNRDDLMN